MFKKNFGLVGASLVAGAMLLINQPAHASTQGEKDLQNDALQRVETEFHLDGNVDVLGKGMVDKGDYYSISLANSAGAGGMYEIKIMKNTGKVYYGDTTPATYESVGYLDLSKYDLD